MTPPLDAAATEDAFASGSVFRRVERDLVTVTGPGARDYLQGQCTQDVAKLAVGESAWSLLLSVQGKVEALVRVAAIDEETFALDTEYGEGEAVLERLRRFKIRVKADLALSRVGVIELRGPALPEPPSPLPGVVVAAPLRTLVRAIDLVGPSAQPPDEIPEGDDRAFEVARIAAGVPRMASELDASVIPFEAGITDETVSFTKGCYTGQELVARLEARGANVPRRLRGVVIPVPGAEPGAELIVGEQVVGTLTSVAYSSRRAAAVGLAYVRRSVSPPQPGRILLAHGEPLEVAIEPLPLTS